MKVIAIGDPHFRVDNILEVELFIDRIEKLAQEQKPDLIVILGDLLHTHERLHTLALNKAYEFVEKMRGIARTVVLVGNHDMCFGENTRVLLWDGRVKVAKEVEVGDVLTGDDNTPRKVLSLTSGKAKMFEVQQVQQLHGKSYTVTEDHILSLKTKYNRKIIEIPVKLYNNLPKERRSSLFGYTNKKLTKIKVVPSLETDYYGWTTDGNHRFLLEDFTVVHNCNNQQFLSENHWMNGMKEWDNVEISDKILHLNLEGFHLVFCPYVPPGRFQEALNSDEKDWKKADCIFAHQEFYGCKMGAIVSVEGDKWPEDYPEIISGHIHSRQKPQKNVYYCGSSMQHAFGESEKNIIPIITFSKPGKKFKVEEVDLQLPRKKIVYTDVESMEDYKISDDTQDKVKISLSGNYEEFKAFKKTKKYKEIIKTGTKVVFKPKKIIKREEEKEEKEETDDNKEKEVEVIDNAAFSDILTMLINKEKNPCLYQAYELVVNSKEISEDDIFYP